MRIGVPVVDLSTGMNACIGILMALYERNRSGKGQFVDATLYDSAVALHQPHAPNYFMAGAEAQAVRQQPRQPGALLQLPDQGPQHRGRRRQ